MTTTTTALPVRMLRLPEVLKVSGFSSPDTVYRLVRAGKFPQPRKLTERSSAWRSDELQAWIESRPQAQQETRA